MRLDRVHAASDDNEEISWTVGRQQCSLLLKVSKDNKIFS